MKDNKLDETDVKIINALRDNSRISMTDLGKKVFLTSQAVRNRVNRLQDLGIVERYTINISCPVFGFSRHTLFDLKLTKKPEEELNHVILNPENHVIQCYEIEDHNYRIDAQFKDEKDVNRMKELLSTLGEVSVHPIKKEIAGLYSNRRCTCGCGM